MIVVKVTKIETIIFKHLVLLYLGFDFISEDFKSKYSEITNIKGSYPFGFANILLSYQ